MNSFKKEYIEEPLHGAKANAQPLRVGTLFSGIGAFEEALRQLRIRHKIVFACDNGEIELIPLDNKKERKEYIDYEKRIRSLSSEEKARHKFLKEKIESFVEQTREICYSIPSRTARTHYVDSLYAKYEGDKKNWVKETYINFFHNKIARRDFHTDIRFMKGEEYLNKVDIIVGGSPCQSFSTYGKKQGLDDARGTLFYDYARIIKECRPKVFIYENVASLKTRDNGKTWAKMLEIWQDVL
nr:DNA (cytosine-5-)-methyltransferase [Bacteroidaceae bacterium]